jgi:SAM-dependent methyltransferase
MACRTKLTGLDMKSYYSEVLAGERLRACYEAAPKRTQQYLEAEIAFVLERCAPDLSLIELGCGYGRALKTFAAKASLAVGIDTSDASIKMAATYLAGSPSTCLAVMNAADMGFRDRTFDLTLCIQNGISAFHVDPVALFREAVRITKPGGRILFSSYASAFWPDRLEWFEAQAALGLIGPIDREATRDGVIVCRDGFRATTADVEEFRRLARAVGQTANIVEVDDSSLFCEILVG